MKALIIAALAIGLVGCAGVEVQTKKPKPILDHATFEVHVVDTLPSNPESDAITTCMYGSDAYGNVVEITDCIIYVKKSVYPKCIAHEIRHVFEGEWHPMNAKIKGNLHRVDC